jgi:ATP-dependent phosphoenolpyruvate carboxykinase
MTPEHFAALKADFLAALAQRDDLFVQDLFGGSQPEHRVGVRVINELAWHNLFIRTLLVRPRRASSPISRPNTRSSTCRASAPIPRATARAARR